MHAVENADPFHIARSRYFDAMAEFETQVVRVLRLGGVKVESECLGQKLDKLAKLEASSHLPKVAVAELAKIAATSGPMLDERNDIVHAVMEIVSFNGAPHAFFTNTRIEKVATSAVGRLISAAQFEKLELKTREVAAEMAQIGKPAPPAKKASSADDASVIPIRAEA